MDMTPLPRQPVTTGESEPQHSALRTALRKCVLNITGTFCCVTAVYLVAPAIETSSRVFCVFAILTGLIALLRAAGYLMRAAWEWLWLLRARHSPRKRSIELGMAALLGCAFAAICFHSSLIGLETGMSPSLTRHSDGFARSSNPEMFWVSIIYYFSLGVIVLYLTIRLFARIVLNRIPGPKTDV
ncbi:hypothetical protein [Pseudomonas veronii]|uniref:hypothetical protein n=1 Tax=Pseudomonas veronii TaxID=76761 RepID=UPI0023DF9A92|nr:hypothetical protein [Pseudomonas veronii]MDF3237783.1 hypothetical protein [Pseudomonas veronii]